MTETIARADVCVVGSGSAGSTAARRRQIHAAFAAVLRTSDPTRAVWHLAESALGPDDANHAQQGIFILYDPRTPGGGKRLEGSVQIRGAKNAVLPQIAAALLSPAPLEITNVPEVIGEHFVHPASFFHRSFKYADRQRNLARVQAKVDVLWLMIKDDTFRDNPPNPDYVAGVGHPVARADRP